MSIDDQILIGSTYDYRIVFKAYCTELDTALDFEEKPHSISLSTIEWNGLAHLCSKWSIEHFEPVVGFKPTMSLSFCLRKTHITDQRSKLVYALFPLIQNLGCEVAYVEDFYEVILRYKKEGQLEIKTQTHFWQHNDLEKIPLPYVELPDLFF
jgi:hypothetical protein